MVTPHPLKRITPLLLGLTVTLMITGCQKAADDPVDTDPQAQVNEEGHHDGEAHADEAHHAEENEHADHAEDEHAGHDHDEHGHEGHDHGNMAMLTYECEPDQKIEAHYPDAAEGDNLNAHLLIDGIEYDLTPMVVTIGDATAKIYETDLGLNDNAGMIWQVDGDKGTLINKTLTSKVPVDQEKVLFTCYELHD